MMQSERPDRPPVSLALERLSIPHRVFQHAGAVDSLEQAAQERGQTPGQVVRTILFRLGQGEYLLVLAAGPGQISWKALRQYVGQSRLSLASAAEVLEVTGYPIGAVGPFGLATALRVLIDPGVLAAEEVSVGSGRHGAAVILKSADLRLALGTAEVVPLLD
jgi:prolyl-tRNA editing enzyme YbaK/EbsC (Cys-tRNA(Pro) deacylase)